MNLKVATSEEYFNQSDKPREIDWDVTGDPTMVSLEEEELITKILTCEASIELLRGVPGGYGHMIDCMRDIKYHFINEYEKCFRTYKSLN